MEKKKKKDTTTGVGFIINPPTYCWKVGLYFFNEDAGAESFLAPQTWQITAPIK